MIGLWHNATCRQGSTPPGVGSCYYLRYIGFPGIGLRFSLILQITEGGSSGECFDRRYNWTRYLFNICVNLLIYMILLLSLHCMFLSNFANMPNFLMSLLY